MTTKTNATESWTAATNEGLRFFWARTHVGNATQFVGTCWEDGGFACNGEDDSPTHDVMANSVAASKVEDLDPGNEQHVAQVEEWYTGN